VTNQVTSRWTALVLKKIYKKTHVPITSESVASKSLKPREPEMISVNPNQVQLPNIAVENPENQSTPNKPVPAMTQHTTDNDSVHTDNELFCTFDEEVIQIGDFVLGDESFPEIKGNEARWNQWRFL
jgi:hypothetical protein